MPHAPRPLLVAFAAMGATAALVPATLPFLAADMGMPTRQLLAAVPGLFGGLFVGVLVAPLLARRVRASGALRIGAAAQSLGVLVVAAAGMPAPVVGGAVLAGFGFGLAEVSGTVLARRLAEARLLTSLTSLTVALAVVAATCPILVVAAGLVRAGRLVLVVASALNLAVVILIRESRVPATRAPTLRIERMVIRAIAPSAIALFCYVGLESILAGWSAATVQSTLGTSPSLAALGTTAFWLLMAAGRMLGMTVLGGRRGMARHHPRRIALVCLVAIGVLLIGAFLLVPESPPASLAAVAFAVLLCGPCYALLVSSALEHAPLASESTVTAAAIASGAAGGAIIPLIVVLVRADSTSFAVAAMAAVFAAAAVWRAHEPRSAIRPSKGGTL